MDFDLERREWHRLAVDRDVAVRLRVRPLSLLLLLCGLVLARGGKGGEAVGLTAVVPDVLVPECFAFGRTVETLRSVPA